MALHLDFRQADRLYRSVITHARYLWRLVKRLRELQVAEDDPLLVAAESAYRQQYALADVVHMKWCVCVGVTYKAESLETAIQGDLPPWRGR